VTLSTINSPPSTCPACVSRLSGNWFPFSLLLLSIFVICFWQFRHTESPLARRLFSVGNPNDFSWRNRVAAWEGAGRMMLDKPVFGFGWGKAEEIYSKQYRAARLEESAAIQMNDYLMLGISAGVPALGCFLVYVGLTMGRRLNHSPHPACGHPLPIRWGEGQGAGRISQSTIYYQLSTSAAAGAVVLLVGFWFDGGLFKLPTCVVFWVLLELARISPHLSLSLSDGERGAVRPGEGRLSTSSSRGDEAQTQPAASGLVRASSRRLLRRRGCAVALRWLAGIVAMIALVLTALHLITPRMAVSERTVAIARRFLVPAQEKSDFEYLAEKNIWSGEKLRILLQHAHLANYNRTLVNWKLDDELYRKFVLSPEFEIQDLPSPRPSPHPMGRGWPPGRVRGDVVLSAQPSTDLNWRRPLWEFFYPRIRKESSLEAATEIVRRELREHVKTTNEAEVANTILQCWQSGRASPQEFRRLSVAALRSVGIPARLSRLEQVEFWTGSEWRALPVK
jgi:hypothetical protein